MDHEWVVEVKDSGSASVTTATVALVQSSALAGQDWPFTSAVATHAHVGSGVYEALAPITPVEGEWTLIVRNGGRSPVVQPLTMTKTAKAGMSTTPSPKTAATLAFSSEVRTSGTSSVRRVRFIVTMYPSSEIVFISGTEYSNKRTRFRLFAEKYRNGLRSENKLDSGVIATLFSTDDRSRETHVPALGGGWLKVGTHSFGSTTGITPGNQHSAVPGSDVSVVDLYQYLSSVGATEPGRVKEVGFFSHSWPGGPILFNTSDSSSSAARDPSDFDARSKDFNAVNVVGWPDMKAAMSSSGTWHVWGCSATLHNLNLVQTAQKHQKLAEDKYFTVNTTATHHGTVSQTIEERTTRARIRADMDTRFRSSTYMAAAAAYLGIPVFGPPPGVGASYHPKLGTMYIDTAYYSVLYAYFAAEFGPEFAPTRSTYDAGYVDYTALAKRAAPAAVPFSSEYYQLGKGFGGTGQTWLAFANGRQLTRPGAASITFKVTAKTDFATAGKSGHQYELHDSSSASNSRAVYVQEDAKIFQVDKDSTGKFTVLGPEL